MQVYCECGHPFQEFCARPVCEDSTYWIDVLESSRTFADRVALCPTCHRTLTRDQVSPLMGRGIRQAGLTPVGDRRARQ